MELKFTVTLTVVDDTRKRIQEHLSQHPDLEAEVLANGADTSVLDDESRYLERVSERAIATLTQGWDAFGPPSAFATLAVARA